MVGARAPTTLYPSSERREIAKATPCGKTASAVASGRHSSPKREAVLRTLTEQEIVDLLVQRGVVMENDHFGLANDDMHSPTFVVKTNAIMDVALLATLARELAIRHYMDGINTVLVPGTGAISLGFATAEHLGQLTGRAVNCVFAMRPTVDNSPLLLKRGFGNVVRGKKVLAARTFDGDVHDPLTYLAQLHDAETVNELFNVSNGAFKVGDWRTHIFTDPEQMGVVLENIDVRLTGEVDVVLVEAGSDIAMGHALALKIGELQDGRNPQLVYAERKYEGTLTVPKGARQYLRRQSLLVGDDVLTTAGSLQETVAVGEAHGGTATKLMGLWNRGPYRDPRLTALVQRAIPTFKRGPTCPQCVAGIPVSQEFGRGR